MDIWGKAALRRVLRRGGSGTYFTGDFHADGPVVVGRGTRIVVAGVHGVGATLRVGKRVVVGRRCTIRVNEGLSIGSDVQIGDRVWIADSEDSDRLYIWKRNMFPIVIADGVRIGDRAIILPGAQVDRDVAPGEIFACQSRGPFAGT